MSERIPTLSIPGLMSRRIDTCDVVPSNTSDGEVELTFHGPEGPVTLDGNVHDIYRLVVGLELALRNLVVK